MTSVSEPHPRDIWTRVAVDPLADPMSVWLARRSWVSPDRITSVAIVLSILSASCFAMGFLRLGGLLFIARFFADCLDGKVARHQGTSSHRGAAMDIAADVGGIALVAAVLMWRLIEDQLIAPWMALGLMGCLVFYNWALAYRKDLAHRAAAGDGGSARTWNTSVPVLRGWVALCRRFNMAPLPWSVEAEIAILGLAPLLLPASWLRWPIVVALAFYLLAGAVNLRRIWRLASLLDTTPHDTENRRTHGR